MDELINNLFVADAAGPGSGLILIGAIIVILLIVAAVLYAARLFNWLTKKKDKKEKFQCGTDEDYHGAEHEGYCGAEHGEEHEGYCGAEHGEEHEGYCGAEHGEER